ncbi:MAG TPA: universal stress protein [Ktedonobacterales bacterium]|nr:universal stress protein [Ktedonobacterales bacterium]
MFQRILVPVDGSIRSEAAIPIAARLARDAGGAVILLRAISAPLTYAFPLGPTIVNQALLAEEQHAVNAYLTHLADLPVLSGIKKQRVLITGPAVAAILDVATEEACDCIVLTSHGRTGVRRWALGSVSRPITRWAPAPVLLLHSSLESEAFVPALFGAAKTSSQGVLVPLDGSPLAEAALEPAVELAEAIASPDPGIAHLLLALWPSEAQPEYMPAALALTGANAYLQSVVNRAQQRHPTIRLMWSVVSALDPAMAILQVAVGAQQPPREEPRAPHTAGAANRVNLTIDDLRMLSGDSFDPHGYRVIAMASHGRSGPNRWLMGSYTERVIDATMLPTLIVHAPTDEIPGAVPLGRQGER